MKQELKESLKLAMKAQDRVKVETLRALLTDIQYEEMQRGVEELPAPDCVGVVQRAAKRRHEEKQFAEQANRPETVSQLIREIEIVEEFLPKQLSAEEISVEIESLRAADPSLNMGGAMKLLRERLPGRFDGKLASEVAKRIFG
jgi:uncharacterized protein YqeY